MKSFRATRGGKLPGLVEKHRIQRYFGEAIPAIHKTKSEPFWLTKAFRQKFRKKKGDAKFFPVKIVSEKKKTTIFPATRVSKKNLHICLINKMVTET